MLSGSQRGRVRGLIANEPLSQRPDCKEEHTSLFGNQDVGHLESLMSFSLTIDFTTCSCPLLLAGGHIFIPSLEIQWLDLL